MSEAIFPSGPWTGFYNYLPGDRHRMDLRLSFANGALSGEGNDDIGRFLIKGRYDEASRECYWTKRYIGGHDVFYRGFREGKGIWGTWEIGVRCHGGFHIWPRHAGDGIEASEREGAECDAVARESADARVLKAQDTTAEDPLGMSLRADLTDAAPSTWRRSKRGFEKLEDWRIGCLRLPTKDARAESRQAQQHDRPG